MITEEQITKIKDFAINLDWNLAFDGSSKGNRHLFRIVSKAKSLAIKYNADLGIVTAGAFLHDSNLEKTIAGETTANFGKVKDFLVQLGIPLDDIEKILHCVEAHDGRIEAKTIEAKIVHDADTLEKMGPLGVIRETWKRCKLGWNTEKISNHLRKHLEKRKSRLHTEEARSEAERLSQILPTFFDLLDEQIKEE